MDACERNFRKIVNQTLVDNPPNSPLSVKTHRGHPNAQISGGVPSAQVACSACFGRGYL
jgi:hypothetical protein